jgi:hypothetical protein
MSQPCHKPLDTTSSTARFELAAINEQIAQAVAERDRAQQQLDNIETPVRLLQEAADEYTREKVLADTAIREWYESGCPGVRPEPSRSMIRLERRIGDLRRDSQITEQALQDAKDALQAANGHLGDLDARRRVAAYAVAREAAEWRLHDRAIPALISALNEFATLESLAAELRNPVYGSEGLTAAREISDGLSYARQSIAVRGDLAPAKRFLNELLDNPEAELPDPGEPKVEHIEPPVMKPLEDGTKYPNIGHPDDPIAVVDTWPNLPNPAELVPGSEGWQPMFRPPVQSA